MYECENCNFDYDPISCRWKCPHCGFKGNCCEGAPLPECSTMRAEYAEKEKP